MTLVFDQRRPPASKDEAASNTGGPRGFSCAPLVPSAFGRRKLHIAREKKPLVSGVASNKALHNLSISDYSRFQRPSNQTLDVYKREYVD